MSFTDYSFKRSVNVGNGIGATDPSAAFEIKGTTRGFLPPRLTTTQRDAISSPATYLTIVNVTTGKYQYYNGTSWIDLFASGLGSVLATSGDGAGYSITGVADFTSETVTSLGDLTLGSGTSYGDFVWHSSTDLSQILTFHNTSTTTGNVIFTKPGTAAMLSDVTGAGYLTATTGNALYPQLSGSYANPSWITSLAWSKITSTPTTLSGYGITNAMSTSHPANAIGSSDIINWNTAYGWGNHASAGYLTISNAASTYVALSNAAYVKNNQANTYSAGMKQTFQASATTAGLSFGGVTANPSGASTGDMWYRSDVGKFGYNDGSTNRYFVTEQLAQVLKNKDMTDPTNTWPTFNQNTTGTAVNITASSNSTITTLSSLALAASQVTLAGLSTSTSTAVTSADNALVAVGKLQAQVTNRIALPTSPNTGDILLYNGTSWINGNGSDRQHYQMNFFEEFEYPVSNRCAFDFSSSGTGAASGSCAPIYSSGTTNLDGWGAPSPVAITTGTTTTGYTWVFQGLSGFGVWAPDYTAGKVVWEWLNVGVRVLSDGTNTYIFLAGMNSNPTAGEPSTGTYFKYLSTESANWQVCSANGSGHTCVITTTAVAAQTKYNLRAEITTAGTMRAYINGTEVAASSGTYPLVSVNNIDASTRNQPSIIIRKIAGTTNVVSNFDAFGLTQYLTTPR